MASGGAFSLVRGGLIYKKGLTHPLCSNWNSWKAILTKRSVISKVRVPAAGCGVFYKGMDIVSK
jgi:hypothetical protein